MSTPEAECNCEQALTLKARVCKLKTEAQFARDALKLLIAADKAGKKPPYEMIQLAKEALCGDWFET